ncbi:MAG: DUF3299 domain-containing protein [Geminicoccaceae bacterium]
MKAHLAEADAQLETDGIDADWVISQRYIVAERHEGAMSAGNPDLDGTEISLAGFAIPAPPEKYGTPFAYLVPERGMCSHMPPPPPNQMVRLRLNDDWRPSTVYEPVAVSGRIRIDPSGSEMLVVDGFVPMRATFMMDVTSVQTFAQPKAASASTINWTDSLMEKLRQAGEK